MNGSIHHRPDRPKSWKASYLAPNRKQPSKSFRTKREAERWLRDQIGKIDKGTWVDPSGGTRRFEDHAQDWLRGRVDIKPKTRAGYENLLRVRVLPTFGNVQLQRIDPAMVRAWIAAMNAEGLSPSRIRQARQVLFACMQQGVADGLIGRNPAAGVKTPTEVAREMRYLDAIQLRALGELAETYQEGAELLITFLGLTGLRWGEAVALRRASLDLLHRRVHVKEAATEVAGHLVTGQPKNHRVRTVVLPKSLNATLSNTLATGAPSDLVFTSPNGHQLRSSNFRSAVWIPATTKLTEIYPELDGLRPHDLRHTAAALAISSNANIKIVQRMLGHKSAAITLDRYGHLYTEDLEELADRIDGKFVAAA